MSTTSGSGPAAPQGRGPFGRWRAWRLRWVSLGAVVVVVVGVVLGITLSGGGSATADEPMVGSMAPGGSFTTLSGQTETLASMHGQPTMLWLMTTWCEVCQVSTKAMTTTLAAQLAQKHVRVLELNVHGNLGHPNPPMTTFVTKYAGSGPSSNANWTIGFASAELTRAYDPKGEMDVYYLLDSSGHVRYMNSGPAGTAKQLLAHASALS